MVSVVDDVCDPWLLLCCFLSLTVVKTLTGHKSSITSLAFHPFQGFLASGSMDTNIKVCVGALFEMK